MEMLLYSEVNILSFVIMVLIAVGAVRAGTSTVQKKVLFVASVLFAAGANVFDFIWNLGLNYYTDIPADIRGLTNFCYFLCLALSTYHWFLYTEVVFNKTSITRKIRLVAAIPIFVLCSLLVVSYFNGCVFFIDAGGVYHRGLFFYAQHILSYSYIFLASFSCLRRALEKGNYDRRNELLAMASFIVPPLICTLIQLRFQSLPVLSVGIVISFMWVYMQVLSSKISNDELTQIPHRNEMVHRIASEIKGLEPSENLFLMFMDIDHFKQVNDMYSHEEGDKALITLAEVLKEMAVRTDGFCARYGGDEFTFLVKCVDDMEAQWVKEEIQSLAKKKSEEAGLKCILHVSIGIAKYSRDTEDMQHFMAAADAAMYEEKKKRKAAAKAAAEN